MASWAETDARLRSAKRGGFSDESERPVLSVCPFVFPSSSLDYAPKQYSTLALGIKKRALQLGAQRLHNDRPLKVLISSSIHPPSPVLSVPLRLPRVPAGVDRTETKGAPVLAVTGHELPAFSVPATGHGVPSAGPAGVPTAGLRRAASHGRVPAPAAAAAGVQGQQRRLHERMLGGHLLLLPTRHVLLISHQV
ncbi:uncharacterized protein LOC112900851 [Panicum hallii]|uniref:uncharacterized protein LOC112900851 n=1 Tax=Panicum hallii TaxID=206008 RepID=UPI000DF4E074|nr:uncharacterized protein LOC112900851 [Panicum hallii]